MYSEQRATNNEQLIVKDLTQHIKLNKLFHIWMAFLSVCLLLCIYAYTIQLRLGLGVTGLRDFVSWGMYISSFVFFVATSLIGMLISSVLGLIGQKWITPITRIAELIAFAFAAIAGVVIVLDMGRPERLAYVFIYGRFQSPILWDVTVVTIYALISLLLYFIPMLPDLAILKGRNYRLPSWQTKAYNLLSLNFRGNDEQKAFIARAVRILLIMVIPLAFSIHTVTSWLFAVTPRAGWNSTIFGPYFISGAFVSGVAAVIIVMYILRNIYKLEDYLTDYHFDKIAKLFHLVCLVYFYFNINEYLVPGYKMQRDEAVLLHDLFSGRFAVMFWAVQIFGLILPVILIIFKPFRKPLPLFIIGIFVLIGAWFKRFLIVVPPLQHPFLPIQYVPHNFIYYQPTLIEIAVSLLTLILVIMIISVFSKIFPVIPIQETIIERDKELQNSKTNNI